MDIIKNRKIYFCISFIIIIIGIAFITFNIVTGKGAFNYDVQFIGGTSIQADIGTDFNNDEIADLVKEVTGETSPQIQKIGGQNSVMIKTKFLDAETRVALADAICNQYGITSENLKIEEVSATISGEMQRTAVLAVLVSCLAILIYVTFRFRDFRVGSSAVLALLHDAVVIVVFYAVFRIPLNNSFIAAVLTILGYSINATIVIFDRIRENRRKISSTKIDELVNRSVTQTMTRSVYTSLTTLLAVFCLYIFGVQSVKEFVLPIIVGIICGTYSSVFLSGSLWYMFSKKEVKN